MEFVHLQISIVHIGDFQLAPSRRSDVRRDVEDSVVVEIETGHRPMRPRVLGLFLDADRPAPAIELDDAVALGLADPVGENRSTAAARGGLSKDLCDAMAEKDVVAEHQAAGLPTHEMAPDDESLGDAAWFGLHRVGQPESPTRSVAEEQLVPLLILWGRNDQYLSYTGKHQCRHGIIN